MKIATSFICLFIAIQFLFCQEDSIFIQNLISGISRYRTALLQKDSNSRIVFGIMINENEKNKWDEKIKIYQRFMPILYDSDLNFAKNNQKLLSKLYGDSNILTKYNIDVLSVYWENKDLIDCFILDILEYQYPFKIKKNSLFIKELEYYEIHNNERIMLLGDSNYSIGILAAIVFRNLQLFTGHFFGYFNFTPDNFKNLSNTLDTSNTIQTTSIDMQSIHMENQKLDKIIMRCIQDYISIEKSFIKSLRNSLSEYGKLFILIPEPFSIEDQKQYKKAISVQEKLFNRLSKYGFILKDNLILDNLILYKFNVRNQKK